jgi:hypothetical protein
MPSIWTRVAFNHGRDLTVSPPQAGGPVNFSELRSYRSMERTLSTDHLKNKFEYSDVPSVTVADGSSD